jgi:hypothetical protein
MGVRRGSYRVLCKYLKEREHFLDLGVDGKIILKWILKNRAQA